MLVGVIGGWDWITIEAERRRIRSKRTMNETEKPPNAAPTAGQGIML